MITAEIIGDKKLVEKFNAVYPTLQGQLQKATARAALKLLRHVKEDKLNGQVLNVKTGRLRRSITMRVEQDGSITSGWVGTNVAYAHRQEFGFHGAETVRSFMRRAPGGKKSSARTIQVRSFTRNANTPERSFLRSSFADLQTEINAELRNAATLTVRDIFGGAQ